MHICVRNALSGVSTYSTAADEARDATEAREFKVAVDCFLDTAVDFLVDRLEVCAGIVYMDGAAPARCD